MSSSIPDPVPPHATPEQLRHIINYWRIEASHNYGRWINAADELNELRKSSFVTAVPSEDYEKLKAENERLRGQVEYYTTALGKQEVLNQHLVKAGDAVVAAYCMGDALVDKWKEYPVVREWNAAKG
jgi:hypothetical protein